MSAHIIALPPLFVTDSLESGCDVGAFDGKHLTADDKQLAELVSRARHYAFDGCDCDIGLKSSARATLARIAKATGAKQ